MGLVRTRIVSLGSCLPTKVVTNHDLEKSMDTTDEWIQQRSGIKERRWVSPGETLGGMATAASKQALERGGLKPSDLDAIIFSSLIGDYVFPGTGVLLQESLGVPDPIPALDIRNQCSGFLYALSIADAWIRAGFYKRVLISASEIHSTSMDKTSKGRDVNVLFGDGAASCIVEACKESDGHIIDTILASEGKNADKLIMRSPSPNDHPRLQSGGIIDGGFFPKMDGKFVFKHAVERMCEVLQQVTKRNNIKISDIDFVIPHQANLRINQMVLQQLEIPLEKSHSTIDRFGNTTSVTIPLTFNEALNLGKVKRGDLVAFVAFGSGFTWGASLVRY